MSFFFFFFNDTATTEIYTLSLRRSSDLLAGPAVGRAQSHGPRGGAGGADLDHGFRAERGRAGRRCDRSGAVGAEGRAGAGGERNRQSRVLPTAARGGWGHGRGPLRLCGPSRILTG